MDPKVREVCILESDQPPVKTEYVFGGGSAFALKSYTCVVRVRVPGANTRVRKESMTLDVVSGSLPLLVGIGAQTRLGLVPSAVHSCVFLVTHDGLIPIEGSWKDGAPVIDLSAPLVARQEKRHKSKTLALPSAVEIPSGTEDNTSETSNAPPPREERQPDPSEIQVDVSARVDKDPDGEEEQNTERAISVDGKSSVESESRPRIKPKVLRLTDKEIARLHALSHAPASRLYQQLAITMSKRQLKLYNKELKELKKRINEVCKECLRCPLHEWRVRPNTSLNPVCERMNRRVMMDMMKLGDGDPDSTDAWLADPWALVIVDEATNESRCVTCAKDGASVAQRVFLEWLRQWGPIEELCLTDNGGEFVNKTFLELAMAQGFMKRVSGPGQPEGHSRAERMVQCYRVACRRVAEQRAHSRVEWDMILAQIENELRNTVLTAGFSASQRSMGRNTSLAKHILNEDLETPIEGETETVRMILDTQQIASEAYRSTVSCRKLRAALKERVRPTPRVYDTGEYVLYYREPRAKHRDRWAGPAVVIGYDPHGKLYFLNHGGLLVKRSNLMLKGVRDAKVGDWTGELTKADAHDLPTDVVQGAGDVLVEERQERDPEPGPVLGPPGGIAGAVGEPPAEPPPPRSGQLLAEQEMGAGVSDVVDVETAETCAPPPVVSTPERFVPADTLAPGEKWKGITNWAACDMCGEWRILPSGAERPGENARFVCRDLMLECGILQSDAMPRFIDEFDITGYDATEPARERALHVQEKTECFGLGTPGGSEPASPQGILCEYNVPVDVDEVWGEVPDKAPLHATYPTGVNPIPLPSLRPGEDWRNKPNNPTIATKGLRVRNLVDNPSGWDDCAGGTNTVECIVENAVQAMQTATTTTPTRIHLFTASVNDASAKQIEFSVDSLLRSSQGTDNMIAGVFIGDTKHDDALMKELRASEVHKYEWDDLTQGARDKARELGINDYTFWECWGEEQWTADVLATDSRAQIFPGRWVDKPKVTAGGELIGKSRWTPLGFLQWDTVEAQFDSPTTALESHFLLEAIGLAKRWSSFTVDFSSAFFQGSPYEADTREAEHFWIECPPELQPPEAATGRRGNKKCRKLLKDVPGLRRAPRSWHDRLAKWLIDHGHERSRIDAGTFWHRGSSGEIDGFFPTHVDDSRGKGTPEYVAFLESGLKQEFKVGVFERWEGSGTVDFLGKRWCESEEGTHVDMQAYIDAKLSEIVIDKARAKLVHADVTQEEYEQFRTVLGRAGWLRNVRPEMSFELSRLGSCAKDTIVQDLLDLNKVVRYFQTTRGDRMFIRRLDLPTGDLAELQVTAPCDSSLGTMERERTQGGYVMGLQTVTAADSGGDGEIAIFAVHSGRIRRQASSSFDAECLQIIDAVDVSLSAGLFLEEARRGPKPNLWTRKLLALENKIYVDEPTVVRIHTDSNSMVQKTEKLKTDPSDTSRRRRMDIADFRECATLGIVKPLKFVTGTSNLTDILTKEKSPSSFVFRKFCRAIYWGMYDPSADDPKKPKVRDTRPRDLRD